MAEPVEHRLALVLNGGISLAVWMGGVAQEIDNLRRASNGLGGVTKNGQCDGDARAALRGWVRVVESSQYAVPAHCP